jgi:soluble lytic murein transglycosylase-like protein
VKWPLALGLVVSALALPATASASADLARIVGPDGTTIAAAPAQAGYAFPADGSVAQVADVVAGSGALRVRGISLLGGRIRIDRAIVGRNASVDGVVVDGIAQPPGSNRVVAVPGVGWALVLQRAVLPLPNGRQRVTSVAVRLHLTAPLAGLPAGSEILIGLATGTSAGVNLTGAASEIPPDLVPIYRAAARRYGVPWSVLAAINRVETSFGRNLSTSSAGAIGWMQFMPGTWAGYGVDADGDGVANPYDPVDAINAAARLLSANGASTNLAGAVFQYNHSSSYVSTVLQLAQDYANGSATVPRTVDAVSQQVDAQATSSRAGLFSPVLLW